MSETAYQFLGLAIVGAIYPIFWLVAKAIPLWLARRFAPSAEWWMMAPLSKVIARLATAALSAARSGLRAFREQRRR